jgi:hypothetical protein
MARIILEDMKSNKARKPTILKKEVAQKVAPIIKKEVKEEKISKLFLNEREYLAEEKETEKTNESKIDEYFNNRNKEKPRLQRTPQVKTKPISLHKPFLISDYFYTLYHFRRLILGRKCFPKG